MYISYLNNINIFSFIPIIILYDSLIMKLLIICYVPELAFHDNMKTISDKIYNAFTHHASKNNIKLDVVKILQKNRNIVINEIKKIAEYLEQPDHKGIIYYYGHGAQIRDTSGDEKDGLDEMWSTQNIVDDELTNLFKNIHKSSYLFLFSDSCSSGSMIDNNNTKNWITISSSNDNQDSLATSDGGIFTLFGLIPALENLSKINCQSIHNYIRKNIDIPSQTSIMNCGNEHVKNIDIFI